MVVQLTFSGEALENREIDIEDLSIALAGFNRLVRRANQILNHDQQKILIKVKSSFETGSFKINISLVQDITQKIISLFQAESVQSILSVAGIIAIIVKLLDLCRFLLAQIPDKIIEEDDGLFKVYKGKKYIKTEKKVLALYKDDKLRKALKQQTSILEKPGIDESSLAQVKGKKYQNFYTIKKSEVPYFNLPAAPSNEKPLGKNIIEEITIQIIKVAFEENQKWTVDDGTSRFSVILNDPNFLQKIKSNEVQFAQGDLFKVKLKKSQYQNKDTGKLRTDHSIEKVIEHIKAKKNNSI